MKLHKFICMLLIVCFSISVVTAFSACNKTKTNTETITVVDMLGESVEVKKNPQKVACVSRTTYDLLIAFGVGDSIDGVYKNLLDNEWAEVFDKDATSRYKCNYQESYETFISRGVDIVFAPEKYIADGLKEHGIKALNVSLYGNPTFENYVYFLADLVKQIWDSPTVAHRVDAWKGYMSESINDIQIELSKHNEPKRKVYYVRGDKNNGIGYTDTRGSFTEYAYNLLGCEFLGSTFESPRPSAEAICGANPDVFVVGGMYQHVLIQALREEPYSNLDAVKNNQIYNIPVGLTIFEQISVFSPAFLHDQANKLYPQYFNFNVSQEIKDLAKEFFDVDLTDAEVNNMLNGLSREGNPLA